MSNADNPRAETTYLWWSRKTVLKNPSGWENSSGWMRHKEPTRDDYEKTPRLLEVKVRYWQPGTYWDPIVQKPIKRMVADITEMERQATWKWQPRERLAIRRQLWLAGSPNDEWSQFDSLNTLMSNHRRLPYQEFEYDYLGKDRSTWYPVWHSYLLADPLMIFCSRDNEDPKNLFLQWLRIDFDEHPLNSPPIPPEKRGWKYSGQVCHPPAMIDATPNILKFGPWQGKR
jgi:hypothetical protein